MSIKSVIFKPYISLILSFLSRKVSASPILTTTSYTKQLPCFLLSTQPTILTSFQNYLSVEARRDRRLKRGGNYEFVSLDLDSAESRYQLEPVDYLTAETIFDARWAMTLLDRAMTLLRHEYAAHGKASTFETLMVFLGSSDSNSTLSYEEAANALGVGVGAVRTLIHRLRKQYTCLLREEVARTVSEPVDVQEEIHALCDALIAAEGRLGP